MRVMLDTNVFISALLFPSKNMNRLIECISTNHELVLSSFVVDELKAVIETKFSSEVFVIDELLTKMNYEFVCTPDFIDLALSEIRELNDYPVLYTAMIEDIDVLVAEDKDFADVVVERPRIYTPTVFIDQYSS